METRFIDISQVIIRRVQMFPPELHEYFGFWYNRRMAIVFFCRLFYPHIGGVEKHVLEISKILIKKGHKIIVFTEQYDPKLKLHEKIEGISIYRIPAGKNERFKKFEIWKNLWKHRKIIEKADIIHCHDVFFWYLPFRFLYFKKPVFTTFHGYESYPIPKKALIMRKVSEELSNGNICVGEFMKKWYGTKPTYTTYGGVRILPINTNTTNKYQSKKNIQLLFIGRLDQQTGIMRYLKAVKILKDKGYIFDLDVLGDGEQRQDAEKFCSKFNLNVRFHGFVNNTTDFLEKANYVFVSRYLGILEAMASKKLVFALYDNPLKEDYLKMTPFAKLVNIVNSEKHLANKVLYFLKNSEKEKEMIGKAFDWSKNQSWENAVRTYIKLWQTKIDL